MKSRRDSCCALKSQNFSSHSHTGLQPGEAPAAECVKRFNGLLLLFLRKNAEHTGVKAAVGKRKPLKTVPQENRAPNTGLKPGENEKAEF